MKPVVYTERHSPHSEAAELAGERARGRAVANMFGWCPDPQCGADVMGGHAHDPMCELLKDEKDEKRRGGGEMVQAIEAKNGAPAGLISRVRTGRAHVPITGVVWGPPGVGKTTFCAHAPKPLVWCLERGAEQIDVPKLDAPQRRNGTAWEAALEDLRSLAVEPHDYGTLVIDTLDSLEALAVSHVCEKGKKETLSDFDWGKGQVATAEQWRLFLHGLESLRASRGMNILLIAHEHQKPVNDPMLGQYDCYRPKLLDRVWSLTNEWCDFVLFACFETALYEKKGERTRGMVTGARILRTVRGTGYLAKNRYSLPPTLPLTWDTFEAAVREAHSSNVGSLKLRLQEKLDALGDAAVSLKAAEYLKKNGTTMQSLAEAINTVDAIRSERASGTSA